MPLKASEQSKTLALISGRGKLPLAIAREGYPDHTAFDPKSDHYDPKSEPERPRWFMVDVRYVRHLKRNIPLGELKQYEDGPLSGLPLVRKGNRLSVMPVTPEQWDFILRLERS